MATRIAWLLNLDSDLELQDPRGYRTLQVGAERIARVRESIADLIAPDDVVLSDTAATHDTRDDRALIAQAFCPTPSALARIAALGLQPPRAPALDILQRVNDRAFSAALGHGLSHSSFVRDMQALKRHLAQPSPTGTYVIKRAFSFAGREQRRVHDGELDDSTRGFCARSFAARQGVQVEPWVERVADFSKHAYLGEHGTLCIGEAREQRCDAMGHFLGMSSAPARCTEDEAAQLLTTIEETGAALREAGYFGPFGIDAFRHRDTAGNLHLNPRCEINARFTMGYPRALLLQALSSP